jgi:hypothetical protein
MSNPVTEEMAGRRCNAPGPAQEVLAPMRRKRSPHQGIEVRHSRSCRSRQDRACNCRPSYQASVWSRREQRRIRRTFPTLAAARSWRADAQVAVRTGALTSPSRTKLEDASERFIVGIKSGEILTSSGYAYKPSTIRGYEDALTDRLVPELGHLRLSEITRNHLQDLADRWRAEGLGPSTVRNALMPLRAIYRRAIRRGEVTINPTTDLELRSAPEEGSGSPRPQRPLG